LTYGVNAVGTVWLLTTSSLHGFIVVKAFLGPLLTCAAALVTFLVFRSTVRRRNLRISWAHHQGWATGNA
jgi:hypothetical protein